MRRARVLRLVSLWLVFLAVGLYRLWADSEYEMHRLAIQGRELFKNQPGNTRPLEPYVAFLAFSPRSAPRVDARALQAAVARVAGRVHEELHARVESYVPDPEALFKVGMCPETASVLPRLEAYLAVRAEDADRADAIADRVRRLARAEPLLAGLIHGAYLMKRQTYNDYGEFNGPITASSSAVDVRKRMDWPSGTPSPYVATVTLIPKKDPSVATEKWFNEDWGAVMPHFSNVIQPRPKYVRNQLVRPLIQDSPAGFDGLAVESWPSAYDVLNPFVFFGAGVNPLRLLSHVMVLLRSLDRFTTVTELTCLATGQEIVFA